MGYLRRLLLRILQKLKDLVSQLVLVKGCELCCLFKLYFVIGKKLNGSPTSTSPKGSTKHAEEPEVVTVDLIFWNDGFTIGQGPLQSYTEPEELKLLDRIKNG